MKNKTEEYNNIYIYHGSDCIVRKPSLSFCKKGKDFGIGFYLTSDKQQAKEFAKIIAKRNNTNKKYINIYKVSDFDLLKTQIFKETNEDWLNCVIGNRNEIFESLKQIYDDYDVIIGKIADDKTAITLNAYCNGVYGNPTSKAAKKAAIKNLLTNRLKDQICLKTDKALERIEFIKYEECKDN